MPARHEKQDEEQGNGHPESEEKKRAADAASLKLGGGEERGDSPEADASVDEADSAGASAGKPRRDQDGVGEDGNGGGSDAE